jgi:putative flippase GtrA
VVVADDYMRAGIKMHGTVDPLEIWKADGDPWRGRHGKPQLVKRMTSEHGKRLMSFSLTGFAVFAAGLGVQVVLVQVAGLPKVPVFVMQLFLSVQVNFLANYHWTWGDRDSPFWRSCWRYNIKRAAGTLLNAGLYPILIHFGMNYLAANTLLVVALAPANYLLGHFWTFAVESGQNLEGMSLEIPAQKAVMEQSVRGCQNDIAAAGCRQV